MFSRRISSTNPYVTSVNQKYVTAKDYNLLYDDVAALSTGKVTINEGESKQVLASESGKVFFIDSTTAASTFILPNPEVGLHYKWIWVGNNNNAMVIRTLDTTDTTGDMLRGGLLVCAAAALNTFIEAASDVNTLTIDDNAANTAGGIGSWVEVICVEDPIWFVRGVLNYTSDSDGVGSSNFSDTD